VTGTTPIRVVVATGNAHKLDEIRSILVAAGVAAGSGRGTADVQLVAMSELDVPSPVEDGDTFEANALLKARACLAATGLPALADDSGLEVDALDGDPGVHSARYAGEPTDDAANNAKLVAALADVPEDARTARSSPQRRSSRLTGPRSCTAGRWRAGSWLPAATAASGTTRCSSPMPAPTDARPVSCRPPRRTRSATGVSRSGCSPRTSPRGWTRPPGEGHLTRRG
jgi:non-canonical purine NTP pyrophosphatase (RdgB/HAM1 family)